MHSAKPSRKLTVDLSSNSY